MLFVMPHGANTRPERKQLRRREIEGGLRFVTFSCFRGLPLLRDTDTADAMVDSMQRARQAHGFQIHAWVIMPEHVHLLVRPAEHPRRIPLDRSLLWMKLSVSKRVLPALRNRSSLLTSRLRLPDSTMRFWQKGGGFDRNIRDDGELSRAIRYIHRNPVEAGLVSTPVEWKWSSVHWWMGREGSTINCDPLRDPRWRDWKGFA
jgi:putative transposase